MAEPAPHQLTATGAIRQIGSGLMSSEELIRSCLDQIERAEPQIKAWTFLAPERALEQARQLDCAREKGRPIGPLGGIPIGIKDIFNTLDMPTAMGSPIWEGFTPGNDARVVSELRYAGGVILGKTVTAEFAVHTPGPTANPYHPEFSPGTSSSGSSAAVAAQMVPVALGSQTAGSIIRPASYCGIYGFKPSFGLIPRTGSLKTTDSLDTVGLMARSAEDLDLFFELLRVHGLDYPIVHERLSDMSRAKPANRPWRVALIRGPKWQEAEPYAQNALIRYANQLATQEGIEVEEKELPLEFDQAHEVHAGIYDKALAYYFQEEFRKEKLVSPIMKDLIRHGQEITVGQYQEALDRQSRLARQLDQLFEAGIDLILNLSTAGTAPRKEVVQERPDNCLIWTLCGVPAISVPAFTGPQKLPFGAQVVGRRYNDYDLLRFVHLLHSLKLAPEAPHPAPVAALQEEVVR